MTIARWGLVPLGVLGLLLGWAVWLLPDGGARWGGVAVAVPLWLFVLAFFRNPVRTPQGDGRSVIAAADGVVADVEELDEPRFIGGRAVRIGIFLSVFDVHVNRAPVDGRVAWAHYHPGRFLDARHPDATHQNEANSLGIDVDAAVAPGGTRVLVRQISGLIARRIVCTHGVGDALRRGELFGMIKFGSRTEIWLPVGSADIRVAVGERVRCGETEIARFRQEGAA